MFSVNFDIDNKFLVSYVISNYSKDRFIEGVSDSHKKEAVNFQNLAWSKSKDLYKLIDGRELFGNFAVANNKSIKDIGLELDAYINELIESPEFVLIRKSTEDAIMKIKNELGQNCEFSSNYIKSLGIDLDCEFTILIVHPSLMAGRYIGNNYVTWSYRTDWPNYNTVYIWHEMLHSYFDHGNQNHAIIELITDEELRFRLNGTNYPPFVGHDFLEEIKTKGLPIWKEYLKNPKKDIRSLIKDLQGL